MPTTSPIDPRILCLLLAHLCLALSLPTPLDSPDEPDQCYYQLSVGASAFRVLYGECTSANGPDGCCLEGHYQPGICRNLGHICCTKPDPDCSSLRNNKAITRNLLKQQKNWLVRRNSARAGQRAVTEHSPSSKFRPARSSAGTRRVQSSRVQTNFEIVEMPAHMQLDAVGFATDGLDRFRGDYDDAADYLCAMLDQKYPAAVAWSCVLGTDLGYSVEPSAGLYMLFYIGNVNRIRVMAFVAKSPSP